MQLFWFQSLYQTYVVDLRARTDAEAGPHADREMVLVVMTILGTLILLQYFGMTARLHPTLKFLEGLGLNEVVEQIRAWLYTGPHQRINRKIFWAVSRALGYILIPLLVVSLFQNKEETISQRLGLSLREPFKHASIYFLMLAVIAPFVVAASFLPSFQHKYPFYRMAENESLFPWFVTWEILYAAQFVGLEIFYRGFMIHGLKRRFGYGCIFVMMIPYMMIHFGKPLPECIGSIIAGFVLGTMSLKSGAVWGGALLHVIVAWSMDLLSLLHQGRLASALAFD